MPDKNFPSPEEIQREFEDFVQKKFGGNVQIVSHAMPGAGHGADDAEDSTEDDGIEVEDVSFDIGFDLKPVDIKAHLDRFVIGQVEAKKALSIAVCDHYNQAIQHKTNPKSLDSDNYAKQNVLVMGPTGVGKTYMIKQIAKLIGVPFVKADATRFSETGYMGANVDDLIKDLVNQADGNIEHAQYGIVYLDEADKLASREKNFGRDVSGRGVQLGLLKLMEEADVDLRAGNDPASQMQSLIEFQQKGKLEKQMINTRHILFIVSGAFTGMEEIIARRLHTKQIGFSVGQEGVDLRADELFKHATTADFIDFGFEPEFIGRMPVRVACDHLTEQKLYEILQGSEGSILRQYESAFRAYGIRVTFTDGALRMIATRAAAERTGARALMTICEQLLRSFKFELPSTDICELEVNEQLIENPAATLTEILKDCGPDPTNDRRAVRQFEVDFVTQHGMSISFSADALRLLIDKAHKEDKSVYQLCEEMLASYEHGLKLIQQNTGQSEFVLSPETIENPKQALERMIRESYQ